jgi:hypothetical protein
MVHDRDTELSDSEKEKAALITLIVDLGLSSEEAEQLRTIDRFPMLDRYIGFKDLNLPFREWLSWIENGFHGQRTARADSSIRASSIKTWYRRGVPTNMARQFRTAIESGIPLRSVLEALD